MNRFARTAAVLRRLGVVPAVTALGGAPANYVTVTGFDLKHLTAAFAAGVLFSIGSLSIMATQTGHWVGSRADREIMNGVKAAGVDIGSLSAADLRARLSYSPEEGRALVAALADGKKPLVDDLAAWLRSMEPERRRQAIKTVLNLSSGMGSSKEKLRLAQAILDLDQATAASLVDSADVAQMLRKMARIPFAGRRALIDADFPVRPADGVRARLWDIINAPNFYAADLVEPMADLARAHPTRLDEIRRYVNDGAPLPRCKAVACTPVPCEMEWRRDYTCQPGYYLTEGRPMCSRIPAPRIRGEHDEDKHDDP